MSNNGLVQGKFALGLGWGTLVAIGKTMRKNGVGNFTRRSGKFARERQYTVNLLLVAVGFERDQREERFAKGVARLCGREHAGAVSSSPLCNLPVG